MEEELSVVNTNARDEHLWELPFINVMFMFCLVRLIRGLKRSLPCQDKGHGDSTDAFQLD